MVSCAVRGCNNRSENKIPGTALHKFPSDPARLKLWTQFVNRSNWVPKKSSCLCSVHFVESYLDRTSSCLIRLTENAIPTIRFPTVLTQSHDVVPVQISTSATPGEIKKHIVIKPPSQMKPRSNFLPPRTIINLNTDVLYAYCSTPLCVHECPKCNFKSTLASAIEKHSRSMCSLSYGASIEIERTHFLMQGYFNCRSCLYFTAKEWHYKLHCAIKHNNISTRTIRNGWVMDERAANKVPIEIHRRIYYECNKCPFKNKSKCRLFEHHVVEHMRLLKDDWYRCIKCSFATTTASSIARHIFNKHENVGDKWLR